MVYLFLTTLIWAFSFGLIGKYLSELDSVMLSSARLLVALLIFLPFLRPLKISGKDRLHLVLIGAIQFGIMYICYIAAYRFAPSHLIALFSVMTPVYVVLIHDLKKSQFTKRYFLVALLAMLGAAVIKAKGGGGDAQSIWIGFALMQVAGFAFAYGQVAYRDWTKKQRSKGIDSTVKDQEVFALLYAGGAATALLATLFLTPEPREFFDVNPKQIGIILYMGAVASGLGFFFWNKGATLASPGVLAAANNLVVPLAIIVSLFVFREIRNASLEDLVRLAIGSALIGSAVVIATQHKPEETEAN